MRVKSLSSLFCAVAFCGTASVAMAGAYGEAEQAEEMPRSAPAVAETATVEEFQPYAYLSVGGLYGAQFFEKEAHQINKTYGWGVNARAGYRFHPNLSAELLFEDVIQFDADSGGNNHNQNIDRAVWTLMPNLKVFPIEGFAEPFIEVGGGLVRADNKRNHEVIRAGGHGRPPLIGHGVDDGYGFGMRFGIGADFYATDNIYITPEVAYVLPLTSDVKHYDHMNVALSIGYAFR